MAASVVFGLLNGHRSGLPEVLLPALMGLAADMTVNLSFVILGLSLKFGMRPREVPSKLWFGGVIESAVNYLCFGFLAVLLQQIFEHVGPWGLAGSLMPLVLARTAFLSSRELDETSRRLVTSQRVIEQLPSRIAEGKQEERLRLASTLHDNVLQSLYNVSLHAQVIREDLRWGRLLALEEDIPGLVEAGDRASRSLRDVIRDLRRTGPRHVELPETLSLSSSISWQRTPASTFVLRSLLLTPTMWFCLRSIS
jgi:signal transduction histidine kinase